MSWKSMLLVRVVMPWHRMIRRISRRGRQEDLRVLILPPAAPGSLGDEAMLLATIATLRQGRRVRTIGVLNIFAERPLFSAQAADAELCAPVKGTTALRYVMQHRKELKNWDVLLILGADILDGAYSLDMSVFYLELASVAADVGIQARVLGFSFNAHPDKRIVDALGRMSPLSELCPRDPVSMQRVIATGTGAKLTPVADTAFLLPPDEGKLDTELLQWLNERRATGRTLVGLNMSGHTLSPLVERNAGDQSAVVRQISQSVGTLAQGRQLSFVLLPHDSRRHRHALSDVEICALIKQELQSMGVDVWAGNVPFDAAGTKAVCAKLDLIVTGRMHVAIASLSVGVPAISMTYQDKFEGLYQLFGLEGMMIQADTCFDSGAFFSATTEALSRLNVLRKQVHFMLEKIKKMSAKNFELD